jgi:hypothetical protein
MMLNSNIFMVISSVSLMGTAFDRPADLAGMEVAIPRRSMDADLASIPIRIGTEQAAPVPHGTKAPALAFRMRHRGLHLVGMPRPRHGRTDYEDKC